MPLYVDIGNTSIKVKGHGPFAHNCIDDADGELQRILKEGDELIISSVVPAITSVVTDLFNNKIRIIKHDDPFSFGCNIAAGVGIDRMLSVQGALTVAKPPFITVDVGTAVTINICLSGEDADTGIPEFKSGLIMPGLRLMLSSLNEHTAQLPLPEIAYPLQPFGTNTETSMIAGVNHYLIGGVERAIDTARDFYKIKEPRLFVTGGGAEYFMTFTSKRNANKQPELVFMGMEYIYKKIKMEADR
jgi:type III pantothenate kinase